MRSVGLFGGAARLPSISFNTRDGLQIPFPEELPVNSEALLQVSEKTKTKTKKYR